MVKYEELRKRKVEENQRKIEELKLTYLSVSLQDSAPKPSPTKKVKRNLPPKEGEAVPVVLRRSGRVANLPATSYKEIAIYFDERPKVRRSSCNHRRLMDRVYASDEARDYATGRAEELNEKLEREFPNYPSFVKPMTQSHVTGGFWLGLPSQFCTRHLPRRDSRVILIDENEEEFDTLYLARKNGLSAGWRGFSIYHNLVDGDALVFQLVKPEMFKGTARNGLQDMLWKFTYQQVGYRLFSC